MANLPVQAHSLSVDNTLFSWDRPVKWDPILILEHWTWWKVWRWTDLLERTRCVSVWCPGCGVVFQVRWGKEADQPWWEGAHQQLWAHVGLIEKEVKAASCYSELRLLTKRQYVNWYCLRLNRCILGRKVDGSLLIAMCPGVRAPAGWLWWLGEETSPYNMLWSIFSGLLPLCCQRLCCC